MILYVDRQGVCSHLKPPPRPVVGGQGFSIGGFTFRGTPPLEVIHIFAREFVERNPLKLLEGVKDGREV